MDCFHQPCWWRLNNSKGSGEQSILRLTYEGEFPGLDEVHAELRVSQEVDLTRQQQRAGLVKLVHFHVEIANLVC